MKENSSDYYIKHRDEILQNVQQYRLENSENVKEYQKKYREANKERLRNEKHVCVCGASMKKYESSRHMKSQKHINYITNIPIEV